MRTATPVFLSDISFLLEMDESKIAELKEAKELTVPVHLILCTQNGKTKRKESILTTAQKNFRVKQDIVRGFPDERNIIRAWNRSKYILTNQKMGVEESRNLPLEQKHFRETTLLIRRLLKKFSKEHILKKISNYFSCCSTGNHIIKGKNCGYSDLRGLLRKLNASTRFERLWFESSEEDIKELLIDIHTPLHKTMVWIANAYAKEFLGREEFDFSTADTQSTNALKDSADNLMKFIEDYRKNGVSLNKRDVLQYLLEALDANYRAQGRMVYPSHLGNSTTWSILLPQYLKELGIVL